MAIDAVLPAGGQISGEFAELVGVKSKALIRLNEITLIESIIKALHESKLIDRVIVVGPEDVLSHPAMKAADSVLPVGKTGPENIFVGLDWLRDTRGADTDRVLIANTDLAFLTPEGVTEFIRACPSDKDICVPVISRMEFDHYYPNHGRQFVLLKNGEWTIGTLFLVNPAALRAAKPKVECVFEARKSQMQMARILGVWFVIKFLTRRLTVDDVKERALKIIDCSGEAVRGCSPELAFDIDDLNDYQYALRHLKTE